MSPCPSCGGITTRGGIVVAAVIPGILAVLDRAAHPGGAGAGGRRCAVYGNRPRVLPFLVSDLFRIVLLALFLAISPCLLSL